MTRYFCSAWRDVVSEVSASWPAASAVVVKLCRAKRARLLVPGVAVDSGSSIGDPYLIAPPEHASTAGKGGGKRSAPPCTLNAFWVLVRRRQSS